jgi:hypothetical protein
LLCCEVSTYARLANVGELFDAGGSPLLKAENIWLFQVDIPNEEQRVGGRGHCSARWPGICIV